MAEQLTFYFQFTKQYRALKYRLSIQLYAAGAAPTDSSHTGAWPLTSLQFTAQLRIRRCKSRTGASPGKAGTIMRLGEGEAIEDIQAAPPGRAGHRACCAGA